MNLAEAKTKALSLMSEYSIDGVLVPADENVDYTNRMNRFASDAQFEIADKLPIESSYVIEQTADTTEGYNKHVLPDDLKQFKYINRNDEYFSDYRIENGKILIRKSYEGTFEVFYDKNPTELTDATLDTYEFEIPKHAHSLIPYYLGGMALSAENPVLSDKLLNMFYSRLSTIAKTENHTPGIVTSVYGM